MHQLQRDLGRVEGKMELMSTDLQKMKEDISEIKEFVIGQTSISKSDWRRLGVVGLLAALTSHLISWLKLYFVQG